jgi:hypothetical protein
LGNTQVISIYQGYPGWGSRWVTCCLADPEAVADNILTPALEYNMEIQAWVLPAIAALHNFILNQEEQEWDDILQMEAEDGNSGMQADFGMLAQGATPTQGKTRAEVAHRGKQNINLS